MISAVGMAASAPPHCATAHRSAGAGVPSVAPIVVRKLCKVRKTVPRPQPMTFSRPRLGSIGPTSADDQLSSSKRGEIYYPVSAAGTWRSLATAEALCRQGIGWWEAASWNPWRGKRSAHALRQGGPRARTEVSRRPRVGREESEPSVTIVIPAKNEARNLPDVLQKLPEDCELILVDGNSTDDTVSVAQWLRPDITIVHQTREGKGTPWPVVLRRPRVTSSS